MAHWGQWMVPQPGPEHWLTLERQRRAIDGYSLPQAKQMLERLCQLSMQQDLIIRAAARHIAELECQDALREQGVCADCAQRCRVAASQPDG